MSVIVIIKKIIYTLPLNALFILKRDNTKRK